MAALSGCRTRRGPSGGGDLALYGFYGAHDPVFRIPMFPSAPLPDYLSFAALAYTFGYMGMMLPPVHLCLLVSKDSYQASLLKSYRHLLMPVLMILATVTILFFITRAI